MAHPRLAPRADWRRKLQCRELHGRNPRLRIRRRSQPGHGDRADRRIGSARRRRTTQYINFYRSAGHLTRTLPQGVTNPTVCFQLVASSRPTLQLPILCVAEEYRCAGGSRAAKISFCAGRFQSPRVPEPALGS